MDKTIKTIKLVPAQGVQTELGKMFLYNASAVNRVIEQINTSEAEVLKTANDAAAAAGAAAESAQSAITTFGKVKECVEKAVETVQAADVSANAAMLDAQHAATAAAESAKTSTQNKELIQGYVKAVETSAIAANLDAASAKSSADAAAESATQANEAARRAGLKLSVVMVLPDVGDDKTIYLVPKDGEQPDVHNEYVWITATQTFELIGTTQVDLTGYATTDYVDTIEQEIRADMNEKDSQLESIVNEHAESITTIKTDLGDLGEQVANIESKIPQGTSDTNPLINKQQLLDEEMDIRKDLNEMASELQTQITARAAEIATKQDQLIAGDNITIVDNVISATGGGGASLPDQAGNEGKVLTTNGTDAEWADMPGLIIRRL